MNERNKWMKVVGIPTLAAILVGTGAILNNGTHRVSAFNPQDHPISVPCPSCRPIVGLVGLTRGQTARLNVVDLSDVPPGPCRAVELTFSDSQGNIRMRSAQCLMPGHAASLDLNGSVLEVTGLRAEIRASVQLLAPAPDPDLNNINLVATLEVFDNETGRTSVVVLPSGN